MRFRRRLLVLYVIFCVGLGGVWLRVAQLQVIDGDEWARFARRARLHTEPLQAPRGRIIDSEGTVLAKDRPVFQLAFVGRDWERRGRVRCPTCGVIAYYRVEFEDKTKIRRPERCRCWSAQHSIELASRNEQSLPALEALPDGNLAPLEALLGLEPGALARRADARLKRVHALVEGHRRALLEAGVSEFLVGDKVARRESILLARPYVFETGISEEAVRLVYEDETGEYHGFRIQTTLRRHYPEGDFAPQLLGHTSKVYDQDELERLSETHPNRLSLVSTIGRMGIERAYQWVLAGWSGEQTLELDRDGQFTVEFEEQPPQRGRELGLSISLAASRRAEQALELHGGSGGYFPNPDGPASGALVMLDAQTGAVLAWAEMPRYDLNTDLGKLFDPQRLRAEPDPQSQQWVPLEGLPDGMDRALFAGEFVTPAARSQSRVAGTPVEPGSTFKVLIGMAMLESGRPVLQSFRCGSLRGTPHCHCGRVVDLRAAICFSCNQFFAAAVRDFGPFQTYRSSIPHFMRKLGIGRAPSDALPEWGGGLFLRNWVDLGFEDIVARVTARFERLHPNVALELVPSRSRHAPVTIGADPALVTRMLTDVVEQVRLESGSKRIALRMVRAATLGREVDVRFEVAALDPAPWSRYVVTHDPDRQASWPLALRRAVRRADALWGSVRIEGALARGGVVKVTGRFDKSAGRTHAEDPRRLRSDDARNVAIGQGPVLVTPLQMARAMAAFANGGRLVTPSVVSKIDGRPIRRTAPEALDWAPAHIQLIRGGMRDVVIKGTARNAGFHRVDAAVYGKTGTAQIGGDWRVAPRGSAEQAWHHWFVGFAEKPGERPVAFACVLHARTEDAAGLTAAPAVADMLAWWFGRSR